MKKNFDCRATRVTENVAVRKEDLELKTKASVKDEKNISAVQYCQQISLLSVEML